MNLPPSPFDLPNTETDDLLRPNRRQMSYGPSVAAVVAFIPLTLAAVRAGAVLLSVLLALAAFVILANVIGLWRRGHQPIHRAWVFVLLIAAVGEGSRVRGFESLLWMFPIVVAAPFLLPRRTALTVGLGALAIVVATAVAEPSGLSYRAAGALCLTLVLSQIFSNIAQTLQNRLRQIAVVDSLTGAYNRHYLDALLLDVIAHRGRAGTDASLLLIDVDRFKPINDDFGHGVGDEVLRELVKTMRRAVRTSDDVFRLGGEEFAVVLPETTRQGCLVVAEKLRAAVEGAPLLEARPVTVSIGAGEVGKDDTPATLLQRCDEALYRAKAEGRNRVVVADAPVASAAPSRPRTSVPFMSPPL